MEIKHCERVNGKGLFSTKEYLPNTIIYELTGPIHTQPNKYTIEIGTNKHILDPYGIYINHSFEPTVIIKENKVISIKKITIGDEICFNYNENETKMACPFTTSQGIVSGKN